MHRWLLSIVGIALLAASAGLAHAQVPTPRFGSGLPTERIVSFTSDATLEPSGTLRITETIVYEFGLTPKHGIFRYVPTQYQEADGDRYYLTFEAGSVTDGAGTKWKFQQSRQGGNEVLKIGDPDKRITGRHTYQISYSLHPVVRQEPNSDLFIYNVTGNDWSVPIEQARATVRFEQPISALNTFCYTGSVGSREQACAVTPDGNGYVATSTRVLTPGEGMTVANDLSSGAVLTYLQPNVKPPINWAEYNGYAVGILGALGAGLSYLGGWVWYRWRRARETEVPQYESPDGLSPAEIGLMIDNRSGMQEITATLIHLAVRGYLKIEQTEPKKAFRKAKYTFRKKKGPTGLDEAEKAIFEALFHTKDTETLDGLDRSRMSIAASTFHRLVRKSLESKGYYAKRRLVIGPAAWFAALVVWIVSVLSAFVAGAELGNLVGQAAVAAVGLVFFVVSFYRGYLTKAGYVQWGEVSGFKRFLSMTEQERLALTDAPKRNPKQFSALLPFAVALGVEKEWAKQFEGIDIERSTRGWYHGTRPLVIGTVGSDLASFGGAINSNFAPISSSSSSGSSGGSSGGFSGGGAGGGGGGSW